MSASADVTFKAAKNADHPLLCDCDYVLTQTPVDAPGA
jgi:hypothetical protein